MRPITATGELDAVAGILSDKTRRAIFLYVKQQHAPVAVNEVAEAFGMHRNAAKFHLDKLLDAGLLSAEFKRINGRRGPGAGRPSKLYRATDVEVSISIPERHYELLAELLLRALTSGDDLESVGYAFGTKLAADAGAATGQDCDGLECVRGILEDLGFEPSIDMDDEGTAWITTENCPFGRVAMEAPDQEVCRLDRAIVRGILESFSSGRIEVREHASIPHGQDTCVRQVIRPA